MQKPLLWFALAGATVVMAFVMVLFIAVAADQDARADDGLSGVVCASSGAAGSAVAGFGGRQLVNAGLVVAVGKEMRLPQRAWVVATAARDGRVASGGVGEHRGAGVIGAAPRGGRG